MVERGFLILALASNYLDVILFQEITVHEKTESNGLPDMVICKLKVWPKS
jgi:hypothetical protein